MKHYMCECGLNFLYILWKTPCLKYDAALQYMARGLHPKQHVYLHTATAAGLCCSWLMSFFIALPESELYAQVGSDVDRLSTLMDSIKKHNVAYTFATPCCIINLIRLHIVDTKKPPYRGKDQKNANSC